MKLGIFLLLIISPIFFVGCVSETAATSPDTPKESQPNPAPGPKRPVLVELFTSEGCSSCPPADRVLILLEKQQPVNMADTITLEFHVDYWDGPSWKDAFSSALFTQRQEEYASAFNLESDYTPQMVVDGRSEFVGSDLGKATNVIGKSSAEPKGKIDAKTNASSVKINISNLPSHESATVFVAAAEDNLTSNVTGGENGGEKLSHTSVVRELQAVGVIEKNSDKFEIETALPLQPTWKKESLRYVVFVQENVGRKVIAVNRVSN
jgi:hypothetical protein